MDTTSYLPLSAAIGLQRAMDVTAGNMANAATSGHRAGRVVFESLVAGHGNAPEAGLSYGHDRMGYADLSSGTIVSTGNPLDMALHGDGWFGFQTQDGQIALGRGGSFVLDGEGNLVTSTGAAVLDAGGGAIALPPDAGIPQIASDGTISNAEGDMLGQIGMFSAPDIASWQPHGDSMFIPRDGAQTPLEPAEGTRVSQGTLEQSNVNPIAEMTRMIEVQRAFERNMQAIGNHDQLRRDTLSRLGQKA